MEKHKLINEDEDSEPLSQPHVDLEDTHPQNNNCKKSKEELTKFYIIYSVLIVFLVLVVISVTSFIVGLFVGNLVTKPNDNCCVCLSHAAASSQTVSNPAGPAAKPVPSLSASYNWGDKYKGQDVLDWLDDNMNADNIKKNLQELTAKPHIAGSEQNYDLAKMIYNQWTNDYKLDKVVLFNYSVLLSYPNTSNPNVLELKNSGGDTLYESHISQEPPLIPEEKDPNVAPPFNAYSANGRVSGPLVYVNYARLDDFLYLTTNLSLNLSDYICMARYGQIFRGNKARLAQHYGCKGLLIYSDPTDCAPDGISVFPDGPSFPKYGTQRGTLSIIPGDPLTPGIPAIDGMFRRAYSEAENEERVPKIPVQTVSYGDAEIILSELDSYDPPSDWVGGLNISYKILQSSKNKNYVTLTVNNYFVLKSIYNVVATIYGAVEPDRFVILGNHRDAWVFGGVDPNSGTAVLMEAARVISELRKGDWRPGRTLVLCSWDAEEYGMIGSTEWVEDMSKLLGAGTMAYLNLDSSVTGTDFLSSAANPLLYSPIWNVAKLVKCPDPKYETIYDQWLEATSEMYNQTTKPTILDVGSGSDFVTFLQSLGITCSADHIYTNKTGQYAVYHSVHDNFYWVSKFADPDFSHLRAVGLLWTKLAMTLSNTPLLPYDPRDYAISVQEIFDNLEEKYRATLLLQGIRLDYLRGAVSDFTDACINEWNEIQHVLQNHPNISQDENTIRIINNKLMNLERAFIHPEGLPGRPHYKHVIYAPSSVNSYGSSLFPGIQDTILGATLPGMKGSWDDVARQIDIVRNHLRYATQILNEPSLKYMHVPDFGLS